MDIGGTEGTEVYAAFDAHLTKLQRPVDTAKVYGAQLFMRAPNDAMGGFYTHLANVPNELSIGSEISRGDFLGSVQQSPDPMVPPTLLR